MAKIKILREILRFNFKAIKAKATIIALKVQ